MTAKAMGLLAIWSTVDDDFETDYLHWLTREHVFERVAVPGFRAGRVFRRRGSAPSEYMILYEQDNAEVMSSEGYQARLNEPTAWTQRVMPNLKKFRRGGGSVVKQAGRADALGGALAVARFDDDFPDQMQGDVSSGAWQRIAGLDRVVNMYAMEVSENGTRISTREKSMRRGEEGIFSGLLVLEALDEAALQAAVEKASADLSVPVSRFEMYDLIFSHVGRFLT